VHELQNWVARPPAGEPAGATAWDGYAAAAVCEAAVESLHTRRTVDVQLRTRDLAVT
jgi:myo-inositol 2-dehydrogenase/D-chiro-inositol 1-dehydrogenase